MAKKRGLQESTAYHEAGHAVSDWKHGFKLKRITIIPKDGAMGSVSTATRLHFRTLEWSDPTGARIGRYHELIVSLLTGRAAQRRFNPKSIRSYQSSSDRMAAVDLICRLHSEGERKHVFRYLEERSRNIVNDQRNWRAIQDLAKALLDRGTMDGTEAMATILASMDSQYNESVAKRDASIHGSP